MILDALWQTSIDVLTVFGVLTGAVLLATALWCLVCELHDRNVRREDLAAKSEDPAADLADLERTSNPLRVVGDSRRGPEPIDHRSRQRAGH